jgi:hypothetical protein
MCRSPYSRSFLPIELDSAEKKAMVVTVVAELGTWGKSSAYRCVQNGSIGDCPRQFDATWLRYASDRCSVYVALPSLPGVSGTIVETAGWL